MAHIVMYISYNETCTTQPGYRHSSSRESSIQESLLSSVVSARAKFSGPIMPHLVECTFFWTLKRRDLSDDVNLVLFFLVSFSTRNLKQELVSLHPRCLALIRKECWCKTFLLRETLK